MMVIPEDVLKILCDYEIPLYEMMRDDSDPREMKETMQQALLTHHRVPEEGSDNDSAINQSKRVYLSRIAHQEYHRFVSESSVRLQNRASVLETLESLKTLQLPEQRSPEWFAMREKVLTASSLADALGKGHFNTKEGLLIEKTSKVKKPFFSNEIMEWGVMYEPVATTFYERLNALSIVEFGLVPHPNFPIFGASPDGICDQDSPPTHVGRMLEIKCPPRRVFTREVPAHYMMQMQGQLETCDLEECDFLQVKLEEYPNKESYLSDAKMEEGRLVHGYTSSGYPKGLVLAFKTIGDDGHARFTYEYSPFVQPIATLLKWRELIQEAHPESSYHECIEHWYRIERYECTLVLRDRAWWVSVMPKIIDFWEDVEHYRAVGNEALVNKREARKQKRVRAKEGTTKQKPTGPMFHVNKGTVEEIQKHFLLESDDDS
jgi:putative phage-type endonuclease